MIESDVAIIGTGPGGYTAALRAAQLGASVICIERENVGGVCLNWGCIPTKALLHCAEVLETAREASRFGVECGEPRVDWSQMQTHKERVVRKLVRGVTHLLDQADVRLVEGEARFLRQDTLEVTLADGTETVRAQDIVIATGSRPMQVPIPGLDDPGVIDSRGVLQLEQLPDSLCIIGSGAIGSEYASLFAVLGVEVYLVEMLPQVVPTMDADIGHELERALSRQGVEVMISSRVTEVIKDGAGYVVRMEAEDGQRSVSVQTVMSAIGRTPNVENVGLDVLGIVPGRKGIPVDNRMRTTVPHVYAIGDVAAEGPMLAHVASHQGIVAVEDALGVTACVEYDAVPACVFSIPEAAGVGMTEAEARETGREIVVGSFPLSANGKAAAMGVRWGFVKVIADADTDEVLGFHIAGPHASDLILEGTLALGLEVTLTELGCTIHPHPTLGEAIAEAALAARDRALNI